MKSIKAKSKNKKATGKLGRVKYNVKETPNIINPDLSSLCKPIDISVSRLCQVSKLLENGSDEVKAILAYECDIVYECRVCRSLFRSLVNFISHKRVYCTEKFNVTLNKTALIINDEEYTNGSFTRINPEEQNVLDENCNNDRILRSQVPREEQKKDLAAIVNMLQERQQQKNRDPILEEESNSNESGHSSDNAKKTLIDLTEGENSSMEKKEVPRSTASILQSTNLAKSEIVEVQNIMKQNTAVLGPNGQLLEEKNEPRNNNLVHVSVSDEESETLTEVKDLVCSICNAKFSTKKTLTFHMKTLHTSHRTCYPCPRCASTFVNTWSVYRHLFKVHKMSNEQVRKLRIQIQEKAFRKETSQTNEFEKDNPTSKPVESLDMVKYNETQEWIDHLETDSELQRCGGCGKRFDRKAALSSHSQYCQRRIAACNEAANKVKKARKPSVEPVVSDTNSIVVDTVVPPEVNDSGETLIRVQSVSSLSKADWNMMGSEQSNDSGNIDVVSVTSATSIFQDQELLLDGPDSPPPETTHSPPSDTTDCPEIVYASDNFSADVGAKKRKVTLDEQPKKLTTDIPERNTDKSNDDSSPPVISSPERPVLTRSDIQIDHTTMMENKIATIANLRKLQCLPCKRKFTSMTNLRRHMAIHIGWNRYRCKLCSFKCFVKYDCVAHCNKMHHAQNNRAVLADMVGEIPQDQYAQDIVIDITNTEENSNEPPHLEPIIDHLNTSVRRDVETVNMYTEKSSANIQETNNTMEVVEKQIVTDNESTSSTNSSSDTSHDSSLTTESEDKREGTDKEDSNAQTQNMNNDPDLRRMVMQVIFGPPEESSPKKEAEKSVSETDTLVEKKRRKLDDSNEKSDYQSVDIKNSDSSNPQTYSKPQRPIRNRVKVIKKDFIYDLKEVTFRKEAVVLKGAACKTLNKKPVVRFQNGEDNIGDITMDQFVRDSNALANELTPFVVPMKHDNMSNKCNIKTKNANSHVSCFASQSAIALTEDK